MNCKSQIITGVDKLKELVEERNEISLTQAANSLKIDSDTVNSWAEILSDGGLIVVHDNFRDKILSSRTWDEHKPLSSSVVRRVKHLWQPKAFNEVEIQKKHKEIKKQELKQERCAKLIEQKLKSLKECESRVLEAEKTIAQYDEKHRHLSQWEKELLQLQERVLKIQEEQADKEQLIRNEQRLLAQARIGLQQDKKIMEERDSYLAERRERIKQHEEDLQKVALKVHKILT